MSRDEAGWPGDGMTREMLLHDVTYWSGEVQRLNGTLAAAMREIATLNGKLVEMAGRMVEMYERIIPEQIQAGRRATLVSPSPNTESSPLNWGELIDWKVLHEWRIALTYIDHPAAFDQRRVSQTIKAVEREFERLCRHVDALARSRAADAEAAKGASA